MLSEGGDPGLAIRRSGLDIAFLALHGRLGEDGCVQGLCELYGIPYTGSSVLSSALAMDKVKSKELFRLHNLPTPPYYTVSSSDDLSNLEEIHGSFGFPVVVKPRGEGSSLGVSKAGSLRVYFIRGRTHAYIFAIDLAHAQSHRAAAGDRSGAFHCRRRYSNDRATNHP